MFLTRNSASDNVCAIERLIRIQWHSVNQFLASRNTSGTLKQTGWRFRQGNFAIASPDGRCGSAYQGDGPQVFLLCLIMRCPPTVRLLIVLGPCHQANAVLSRPTTGLSALAPAQRAGGVLGMFSSLEVKVLYPT